MDRERFDKLFAIAKEKHSILQEPWEFFEFLKELEPYESILEIGSYKGGSALFYREMGLRVACVDVDPQPELAAMNARDFLVIQGDSQSAATQLAVTEALGGEVDCLFIDGGHTAEEAMRDFVLYSELVIEGGIIAFHDIVESDEFKRHNIHVYKTWRELKQHYPHKEIVFDCSKDRGIGILYV